MNDTTQRSTTVPLLVVLAVTALVSAAIVYGSESSKVAGRFSEGPNYAPALLLLGVAAFLFLIAAILASGRSDRHGADVEHR